ncbi:zinc-finger domain-containing protein [Acidisoma sp. C75]
MMKAIEMREVSNRVVSCEGTGGQLGHPKVYLRLPAVLNGPDQVQCPYCSRLFVLSGEPVAEGH